MFNQIEEPLRLAAALDEMKLWIPIMMEHAKFIRGGLNPSLRNEELFRTADQFAVDLNRLMVAVNVATIGEVAAVNDLMALTIKLVAALRNFKQRLFELISGCQVIAELPASALDHMRREADFFLTVLYRAQGQPGATDQALGIPDGQLPAGVIARGLIPQAGSDILKVARDENLFHLRTQYEHGEVLNTIAYRPKIQDSFYQQTDQFINRIQCLYKEARKIPNTPSAYVEFNNKVRIVMVQWFNFLRSLYHEVITCKVPSGQINAPALLLDHMSREVAYYISILDLVNQTLSK